MLGPRSQQYFKQKIFFLSPNRSALIVKYSMPDMALLMSEPLAALFFNRFILMITCVLPCFGPLISDAALVGVANLVKGLTVLLTRRCLNFYITTCKKRFQIIPKPLRRTPPGYSASIYRCFKTSRIDFPLWQQSLFQVRGSKCHRSGSSV